MPNTTLTDFLKDPDQTARRAELAAFIGPRPNKFLDIYDSMVAVANRPPGTRPPVKFFQGFCWPAFFLGPIWMFYRKMWVYAGIVVAIMVVFTFIPIPHGVGIGLGVAIAVAGARLYVTQAIGAITKLRNDPTKLAAAGGVSLPAGIISGVLYLNLIAFIVYLGAGASGTQTLGGPSGTYSAPR